MFTLNLGIRRNNYIDVRASFLVIHSNDIHVSGGDSYQRRRAELARIGSFFAGCVRPFSGRAIIKRRGYISQLRRHSAHDFAESGPRYGSAILPTFGVWQRGHCDRSL